MSELDILRVDCDCAGVAVRQRINAVISDCVIARRNYYGRSSRLNSLRHLRSLYSFCSRRNFFSMRAVEEGFAVVSCRCGYVVYGVQPLHEFFLDNSAVFVGVGVVGGVYRQLFK